MFSEEALKSVSDYTILPQNEQRTCKWFKEEGVKSVSDYTILFANEQTTNDLLMKGVQNVSNYTILATKGAKVRNLFKKGSGFLKGGYVKRFELHYPA